MVVLGAVSVSVVSWVVVVCRFKEIHFNVIHSNIHERRLTFQSPTKDPDYEAGVCSTLNQRVYSSP